ncbi:hypothetical protein E2562_008564 [Oryza meyeriana var. granulata]|uniref:Uncharacterized protein n=1 Tax=Oryza meyeriana var. granulata TaxID=110450 RepID=A0A6G1C4Z1_9ORYZ|nr:hypothetical protein E2562_008564 [Oryza meyeriana var. granulata]
MTIQSSFFPHGCCIIIFFMNVLGAGLGYGFPGLTLGFGVGAGCGVGFGFGYGLGKGIAYDENKRYSNVGKMFQEVPSLPMDTVAGLVDELVVNTKKFVRATSKEIEKWR